MVVLLVTHLGVALSTGLPGVCVSQIVYSSPVMDTRQYLRCCCSPPSPAAPGKLELHAPQHGRKNRMPRCSPYLIAQVSEVQGARCSTVTAFHNIAEVGFTTALGPAQVLEVVEEEFPLHQEAAGEEFTLPQSGASSWLCLC